jgi:hypothetical protein
MADPVGEFSLEHGGTTYLKTDDGVDSYANFMGTATGFGTVSGTLKVSNPLSGSISTSGACTWASQAFLDDGTSVTSAGEGTYEQQSGEHRWVITLDIQLSNGDRLRSEGEINLQTLVFSGKIYAG